MTARVARGVALALIVAYYGLGLIGAIGNRDWLLLSVLCVPLAYLGGRRLANRRAHTQPATVPADRHEGG